MEGDGCVSKSYFDLNEDDVLFSSWSLGHENVLLKRFYFQTMSLFVYGSWVSKMKFYLK